VSFFIDFPYQDAFSQSDRNKIKAATLGLVGLDAASNFLVVGKDLDRQEFGVARDLGSGIPASGGNKAEHPACVRRDIVGIGAIDLADRTEDFVQARRMVCQEATEPIQRRIQCDPHGKPLSQATFSRF
jgi:hypothetical protein